MDLQTLLGLLKDGGTLAVLLLIIVSGAKEWWVWGYIYKAKCREVEEWKELALRGTNLADRVSSYAIDRERRHD